MNYYAHPQGHNGLMGRLGGDEEIVSRSLGDGIGFRWVFCFQQKGVGMLILTRAQGEEVVVGNDIRVVVVEIRNKRVRLGFTGPKEIEIDRLEIRAQKDRKKKELDDEQTAADA